MSEIIRPMHDSLNKHRKYSSNFDNLMETNMNNLIMALLSVV